MKTRLSWVLALVMFICVAVIMTAGPSNAVTKEQVKAKTLSLSDMPIGWSVESVGHPAISGCLSPVFRGSGLTTAKVQYEEGGNVPVFQEEVVTSKSLPKTYSSTVKRLTDCHSVSGTVQGQPVTATVGALSYPKVGNQSAAFNVNATLQGVDLVEDFVVFRSGPYVAGVVVGNEGSVDTNLLQGFVNEALDKIEGKATSPPTTS